jgi:hypothetical protein
LILRNRKINGGLVAIVLRELRRNVLLPIPPRRTVENTPQPLAYLMRQVDRTRAHLFRLQRSFEFGLQLGFKLVSTVK